MKRIRISIMKGMVFCLIAGLALPVEASSFLAPPQMEGISHIILENNKKRLREICKLSESISVPQFNPAVRKYLEFDRYSWYNLEKALQWILTSPLAQHEETWDCLKEIALHPCGAMILSDVVGMCSNIDDPRELDLRYPYGIVGLASKIAKGISLKEIFDFLKSKKFHLNKEDRTNLKFNFLIKELADKILELLDIILKYGRLSELLEKLKDSDNTIARNISVFIADFADEINRAHDSKIFEKPSEIAELFERLAEIPNDLVDKNKLEYLFLSLLYQAITANNDRKRNYTYGKIKKFIINTKQIYKFWNEDIIHVSFIKELYDLNENIAQFKFNTISIMKELKRAQLPDQSL